MQKTEQVVQPKLLVGLSVRTQNTNEVNPMTAKIPALVGRFWAEKIHEKIPNKIKDSPVYAAYFDYESDHTGPYTYLIGQEVTSFSRVPSDMAHVTIPAGRYVCFTAGPGPLPFILINAWQEIWKMSDSDFGGKRAYMADFEVYDARAKDPMLSVIDVCLGLE